MFALAKIAGEHRFADQPQVESCIVADNLPVEWWIAIDEFDRKPSFVCIEIAELLMFATKELRLIELKMGRGVVCLGSSVMASAPDLRACHPSNPLPCDKFLSVPRA